MGSFIAYKTHTIIVDNIHYAGTPEFNLISEEQIKEGLKSINPNYTFVYEKGGHLGLIDKAALIATIEPWRSK